MINHDEGGVHEILYQADHSDGFNADFFYNSTADEIIFKRIKPIIKDFELKLKSVSPPLGNSLPSDHQQEEKNNNYLHQAGVGPNIFKPLLPTSIITRKPTLAQSPDQNLKNKYLNQNSLSTNYLGPSIFNLNLDLNKTEQKEENSPPVSESYLPPPKSSSIVQEKIKIVSVSDSYLPPPKTSNIDLSILNPTTTTIATSTQSNKVIRGNSKKTKETLIHTNPYSYIAPIKPTPAPPKSFLPEISEKEKIKPSVQMIQYSAQNSYLPPNQDLAQVLFSNLFLIFLMTFCFQINPPTHDLDRLVTGQSHKTDSVSDNVDGHKNKESSNDGEPTATEKYSTETAEKYLSATGPVLSVDPGVTRNDTTNIQPGPSDNSLEVRKNLN